jgi:serine/threonine protein kinase
MCERPEDEAHDEESKHSIKRVAVTHVTTRVADHAQAARSQSQILLRAEVSEHHRSSKESDVKGTTVPVSGTLSRSVTPMIGSRTPLGRRPLRDELSEEEFGDKTPGIDESSFFESAHVQRSAGHSAHVKRSAGNSAHVERTAGHSLEDPYWVPYEGSRDPGNTSKVVESGTSNPECAAAQEYASLMSSHRWELAAEPLGKGSFGQVTTAKPCPRRSEDIEVVIKTELASANKKQLDKEATILADLQGPGIAEFFQYVDNRGITNNGLGTGGASLLEHRQSSNQLEGNERYLVMQKLGIDLEIYREICGGKLSETTVLQLAYQMAKIFQHVHEQPVQAHGKDTPSKKYVYRDNKPPNWVLGLKDGRLTSQVHLIDFGLTATYEDPVFKCHMPQKGPNDQLPGFAGTQRYASMNALRRYSQSRRDDMETLGYVWSHLYTGALPWAGMQMTFKDGENPKSQDDQKEAKNRLFERLVTQRQQAKDAGWSYTNGDSGETVTMLPEVLKKYMDEVMDLEHTQRPNYEHYLEEIERYTKEKGIDLHAGFVVDQEDGQKLQC